VQQTYVKFRAAVNARDLAAAFETAKQLPGLLSLIDALELTLLAAEKDQRLFDDCAARWVARVTVEKGLDLADLIRAAELLRTASSVEPRSIFSQLCEYTV
jgi:hypothetical protein